MFANIYADRSVLVTGYSGFKGSWLSAWLVSLGARVSGFASGIPTEPSCCEEMGLETRISAVRGDVRDPEDLSRTFAKAQPEIVFHLAAQALVRESYRDPAATFSTNVMGTFNVLNCCRETPSVKAAVIITSDKCYRNNEWVYGYRETDRLGGSDPYSASKACAEIVSHSCFDSFFQSGAACATARAGNVIGGGDWAKDRIVPDCARAWAAGETVLIRNPAATRPWQHVLEPLSGYLWLGSLLLQHREDDYNGYLLRGQSYNFGPPADAVHSVAEVVDGLARHWPGFRKEIRRDPGAAAECGLLKLCCDKALAELEWKPTLDFDETIRYTAEWYSRYHAGQGNMWDFSLGQIAAYTNAALNRGLKWSRP